MMKKKSSEGIEGTEVGQEAIEASSTLQAEIRYLRTGSEQ